MSMLIAALIFVPLLAVSFAHFIWAMGGNWPIRDRALLARTVVGTPGVSQMPNRVVTFIGAVLILTAGIVALSLADHSAGGLTLTLLGALLAAIFLGRGVLGYTAGWRRRFPTEPFATLDRRNYSPLCLIIGAGFVALVVMRLI